LRVSGDAIYNWLQPYGGAAMLTAVKNRTLVVVLSNDGQELDRALGP
jgi:hypothetical protein